MVAWLKPQRRHAITAEPDTTTSATSELAITLPTTAEALDQNEEFCDVTVDGRTRRIRFHDYAEIYKIPGLYEALFAQRLRCRSPQVLVDLLGSALERADEKPESLRVLDFGAGNGMVGEELVELGVEFVIGVDLLPEARDGALRDRPEVYRDYLAGDMTALDAGQRQVLADAKLNCLTCVAALGFDDIPPAAFAAAFNAIDETGWVAFNLRDRFVDSPGAFSQLLERMLAEGVVTESDRTRYRHRLSVSGEDLNYIALAARKHRDIPSDWLA